jgi:hypothetical protein
MMGLIGIGLTLLAVFLNAIRKFPGFNENRYVIVVAVMIFCGSSYIWINGDIYFGMILMLIGIFFIFGHFLHLQKNAGSKWSTPIWQIYIPIGASLITFGPLFYLVETEKVISNVSPVAPSLPADAELAPTLREQFSLEDIERARSAPEEKDLNDVRKGDPEGAEPVEQDFSKEEDPR